ncbi:hypothetical protein MTO96_001359 [Rhipicephalus appendiculatus]
MARATALTKGHANDPRAYYVDVAKYPHRPNTYAAAVIAADTGVLTTSGSIRCKSPTQAEEFAIALALAIPDCRTVLSDSKPAIVNFATNNVHGTTARVCSTIARPETNVTVKWFPAHAGELDAGPNRNEEADAEAHALTSRGSPSTHSSEPQRPDAEDEEQLSVAEEQVARLTLTVKQQEEELKELQALNRQLQRKLLDSLDCRQANSSQASAAAQTPPCVAVPSPEQMAQELELPNTADIGSGLRIVTSTWRRIQSNLRDYVCKRPPDSYLESGRVA